KHAITMPNTPATIDPGYRGEIKVILLNLGLEPYEVHAGDRIAQMVIARYEAVEWVEADLSDSTRGAGGFGSPGRCFNRRNLRDPSGWLAAVFVRRICCWAFCDRASMTGWRAAQR